MRASKWELVQEMVLPPGKSATLLRLDRGFFLGKRDHLDGAVEVVAGALCIV